MNFVFLPTFLHFFPLLIILVANTSLYPLSHQILLFSSFFFYYYFCYSLSSLASLLGVLCRKRDTAFYFGPFVMNAEQGSPWRERCLCSLLSPSSRCSFTPALLHEQALCGPWSRMPFYAEICYSSKSVQILPISSKLSLGVFDINSLDHKLFFFFLFFYFSIHCNLDHWSHTIFLGCCSIGLSFYETQAKFFWYLPALPFFSL